MDRAVLDGRVDEMFLAAGPVMAGHRARRGVDASSVQVVARGVGDMVGCDAVRADSVSEIPSRDQSAAVGFAARGEFVQLRFAERMPIDARPIVFPLVLPATPHASRTPLPPA